MDGYRIQNGFIDFAKTDFICPHCFKKYDDLDNKYLDRCNKNKSGYTTIKCECEMTFGMTYDIMGEAVSFELKCEHGKSKINL